MALKTFNEGLRLASRTGRPADLYPATVTDDCRCVGPWRMEWTTDDGRRLTLATCEFDAELLALAYMCEIDLVDGETGKVLVRSGRLL